MREIVYCEDCPIPRLCREEDLDCNLTRHIAKVVAEAPPLTQQQIETITRILGGPR